MSTASPQEKSAPSSRDILVMCSFFLSVVTLMGPHRKFVVVFCSLLIFAPSCWWLYWSELNWVQRRWWIKPIGYIMSLIISGSLAVASWPRKEAPEIVLKIDSVSLPIKSENDFMYSMDIRGRFPSYVDKSYGPADKHSDYWPSKDMEYPSPALRYTLINRGKSILYNLKLDLEIIHDEAVTNPSGFSQGNSVYRFASAVNVDELIPYGLTSQDGNFIFYVRNLSEDFVHIVPSDHITISGNQKVKIKTLGTIYPLVPPKVWRNYDEKK